MPRAGCPSPTFFEEEAAFQRGILLVAGVDEAGRGAWAGPVAAAAVALPRDILQRRDWIDGVIDSKMLTARQRERLAGYIGDAAVGVGFGVASPAEIDRIGIANATRAAMMRALAQVRPAPQFVLVDFLRLPELTTPQKGIVKGDALCLSIAAASIVAKVRRDAIMCELDLQYPGYGFADHKGYGTKQHQAALETLGACPIHRMCFQPLRDLSSAHEFR